MNLIFKLTGLFLLFRGIMQGVNLAISKINIVDARINLLRRDAGNIVYDLELVINNSSEVSVPIENFTGGVYFGDRLISTIKVVDPVSLPANTDGIIILSGQIELLQLLSNLSEVIISGDWKNKGYIRGQLKAGGLTLPVNKLLKVNDFI